MRKFIFVTMLILFLLPGMVWAYQLSLFDFEGADAEVLLDITGDGTTSITFDIQVIDPAYADITSLWFNFDPFPGFVVSVVSGGDWTYAEMSDNNVSNIGGVTPSPLGPFDFGVYFGTSANNDIYSTSFTITKTDPMNLGSQFAAYLEYVGDTSSSRTDYSKLVGTHNPVPEPTTMLLFGAGLVGLAGFRKRFKK